MLPALRLPAAVNFTTTLAGETVAVPSYTVVPKWQNPLLQNSYRWPLKRKAARNETYDMPWDQRRGRNYVGFIHLRHRKRSCLSVSCNLKATDWLPREDVGPSINIHFQ
ncbi:hypothetical protein NPIL_566921 [Nephila pilipes]|uniref:Uncharacterized protein n=1 Tax=Nephila pilipes TaxID=299642 RepID=A0A8X6MKE0_NEPPI|nr:hypothetical protein NPIL_566921 [Nephila pilipes]